MFHSAGNSDSPDSCTVQSVLLSFQPQAPALPRRGEHVLIGEALLSVALT